MHKIGILGAAGIAPQAIIEPVRRRNDVMIQAVASRRAGAGQAYAYVHKIPGAYDGYEAMLADPEIDIIYNALPPSEHAKWTIAALQVGKHVLCEKPFAMNAREARQMVAAAKSSGLRLVEAFHDRYHPAFLYLLELKASGKLGKIVSIKADFSAEIPFSKTSLRHVPDLGGGALMDLGCYPVHWVRNFIGSEPEVVAASGKRNALGVDESIAATLRFSNGVFVDLSTGMAKGTPFNAMMAVEAENGSVEIENIVLPHKGHSIRERLNGGFRVHTLAGGTTYDYQLAALLKAVDSGEDALTGGTDAINNMKVIEAIYKKAGFAER